MTTLFSILIVALAFVIWRIARHIAATYQHIDEDTLRDFWTQRLKNEDPKEYKRVAEHLAQCQACRNLMDDIRNEKLQIDTKRIDRRF